MIVEKRPEEREIQRLKELFSLLALRAGVRTIYDRHSSISDAASAVQPV
jgi:hypothetical protein